MQFIIYGNNIISKVFMKLINEMTFVLWPCTRKKKCHVCISVCVWLYVIRSKKWIELPYSIVQYKQWHPFYSKVQYNFSINFIHPYSFASKVQVYDISTVQTVHVIEHNNTTYIRCSILMYGTNQLILSPKVHRGKSVYGSMVYILCMYSIYGTVL